LKVADFGLARSIASLENETVENPVLTDYVATRWYRAPEILLGSTKYTKGVDMWSVGCILGELLGGKPMFPGTSTMNQLDRIIEVTGRPSAEDIEAINSPFAATMLESLPPSQPRALREMYPHATDQALDLLRRCLAFNPTKRITALEALEHPYVSQFHNADDEPACEKEIRIAIDDDHKFSIQDYRNTLYQEVINKKKECKRKDREKKAKTEGGEKSRESDGEDEDSEDKKEKKKKKKEKEGTSSGDKSEKKKKKEHKEKSEKDKSEKKRSDSSGGQKDAE